mgnify:CR=1 FL=1|tara:strand:- start:118 stop:459 length:342 start_codon:yes stop_codon:yes gene_type:complete
MKKNLIILFVFFAIFSCGGETNKSNPSSIAKKTIKQKIDVDGMGMLEGLKIESVNQIDEKTFEAVHTFTNPIVKRKMRITRKYYLNSLLDSVMKKEEIKTEMETEGEFKEVFK